MDEHLAKDDLSDSLEKFEDFDDFDDKATGRNKNWYNIREDSSEETKSVNLDEVEWESINDQASINLVSKQEQGCTGTIEAKVAELQKLKQFDTYEDWAHNPEVRGS